MNGRVAASEASGADGAPLVTTTGKVPWGMRATVCERPKAHRMWLFRDGSVAPVRCEAPNKCSGCAMLAAVENALVLRLDAFASDDGVATDYPSWGLTTTTRQPWSSDTHVDRAKILKYSEKKLFERLRDRYGRVEYVGFVEFTTGRAATSAGGRRAHVHHLVKGLGRPDDALAVQLEQEVSALWLKYTRDAWRVECRPLRTPMGAIAYLALHHHKDEQRPPKGWTGKRFRPSQGYFARPLPELRREARALLADRRIERAMVEAWDVPDGFDGGLLDELIAENIDAARERALAEAPVVCRVTRSGLIPVGTLDAVA